MKNVADFKNLSPEQKRALLKQKMSQKADQPKVYPLSMAQHRMWLLYHLDPESPAYNLTNAYRLKGSLAIDALEKALNQIVARHEVLRTTIGLRAEQPVQLVGPHKPFKLAHFDLSNEPIHRRQEAAYRLALTESQKPFDLKKPLYRFQLVKTAPNDYILMLIMHHLVSDYWSYVVIAGELKSLYAAFIAGNPSQLPPLKAQFKDYTAWERQTLEGPLIEKQIAYWCEKLADIEVTELPTDRSRPPVQTTNGAVCRFNLPASLKQGVAKLSQNSGASPFMIYLAVFLVLLARYSSRWNVCCGSPIANRIRSEVEAMVGYFVNFLVIRADLSENPSFYEALNRVRRTCLEAFDHANATFDRIVQELNVPRDPSRNPLFQVTFQRGTLPPLTLANLSVSKVFELDNGVVRSDIEFYIDDEGDAPAGTILYNHDLYQSWAMDALGRHYGNLLSNAISDPTQGIARITMLDDQERQLLLVDWNQTESDYPKEQGFISLFEAGVRRHPDAAAVVCNHAVLTYEALNQRARDMANVLWEWGVGPEVTVALLAERGFDLLIAILGTFKTGAAYLPLDPDHPATRYRQTLERSKTALALVAQDLKPGLNQAVAAMDEPLRPRVATMEKVLAARSHGYLPAWQYDPKQLSYVIFTSGSTGVPKGAMVTHDGMLNHLLAKVADLEMDQRDRLAQTASQCFDISVWQFLAGFLVGGQCCILPNRVVMDPVLMTEEIAKRGISIVEIVPSLLRPMLEMAERDEVIRTRLAGLDWMVLTGEALPPDLCNRWLAAFPRIPVVNAYGPTECSDDVTHCFFAKPLGPEVTDLAIGKPIANARLYIVDQHLQPLPVGVPGELLIGGEVVGRGYLNGYPQTAVTFIPDDFLGAGGRLYRTGDLARYLADGNIQFLGRIDHQVKVRGFRIELGEIEVVLGRHPAIREVVVLARSVPNQSENSHLVAYVSTQPQHKTDSSELQIYLGESLPEYMVPATFVFLKALPLTPNGKINRNTLPEPDYHQNRQALVTPRNPLEEQLAAIWKDVLKLETVSVTANFFETGGNSILGLQIMARANHQGLRFSADALFRHQTIAALAGFLAHEPDRLTAHLKLSSSQLLFLRQNPDNPAKNARVFFLTPHHPMRWDLLKGCATILCNRYDALRMGFNKNDEDWSATFDKAAQVAERAMTMADFAENEALAAIIEQQKAGLKLHRPPLWRLLCLKKTEGITHIVLLAHPMVMDEVSVHHFINDLTNTYGQLGRREEPDITTPGSSWQVFMEGISSTKNKTTRKPQLQAAVRGFTKLPEVPLAEDSNWGLINAVLDEERTRALLRDVPPVYNTRLEDVLITALTRVTTRAFPNLGIRVALAENRRFGPSAGNLALAVGPFEEMGVRILTSTHGESPGDQLKSIKELLRSPVQPLWPENESLPSAEIALKVPALLGQTEVGMFATACEPVALHQTGNPPLSIDVNVVGDGLQFQWRFQPDCWSQKTVARLAQDFNAELVKLISHCLADHGGGRTPSDFPFVNLTQPQVDRLMARFGDVEDVYGLTPMQQGMIFHSMFSAQSRLYTQQIHCRLRGALDLARFERAWQTVIRRHAILRTVFISEQDQLLQVVLPTHRSPVVIWDWRVDSEEAQQQRLRDELNRDLDQGFDFSEKPPLRFKLIQREDQVYTFIWTYHHALLDGWSVAIAMEEVSECYQAERAVRPSNLGPARPYRDYIQWLEGLDLQRAGSYWKQTLSDFSEPNQFPNLGGGRTNLVEQQNIELPLDQDLYKGIGVFAKQHGLTLNTLLQGAWALLLSHYSCSEDAVFGVTVSGRTPELLEAERMVGLFINTKPLRCLTGAGNKVLPWLQHLQDNEVASREFEFSSLAHIQEKSEVPPGQRLFDSFLVYENFLVDEALKSQWVGMALDQIHIFEKVEYPMVLQVMPDEALILKFKYDPGQFSQAAIIRMSAQVGQILNEFQSRPQADIRALSFLPEDERRRVLVAANETRTAYSSEKCLHHLFEEQVLRTPDNCAVTFKDFRLTYCQLNHRANKVANYLIGKGVRPGDLLGVCHWRGIDMVVCLLAIVKTGGAYVPVLPDWPRQRIADILQDTKSPYLLTQSSISNELGEITATPVCLDREEFAAAPDDNPQAAVSSNHLSYIIFTSGSTGRPKGVVLQHRPVVNLIQWVNHRFSVGPEDRLMFIASVCFDLSVYDVFGILATGASLWVVPEDAIQNPETLVSMIENDGITFWDSAPAALWQLVSYLPKKSKGSKALRLVFLSGDWIPLSLAPTLLEVYPNLQVIGLGGATEAAIWSNFFPVTKIEPEWQSVPYGKPIQNARYYVLDQYLNPCAVGVHGDLYIADRCLSIGYFNRPGLTAERYIPDPFNSDPGYFLYTTGDRARWMPEGQIEFLGRLDHQVKIRGFRIELGEIEAMLNDHPQIKEAVVLARGEKLHEKRLVAYVQAIDADLVEREEGPTISSSLLREYLKDKLPEYMVPPAYVFMKEWPVTANGKLDRKALPSPDELADVQIFKLPSSPLEKEIAAIWLDVLGIDQIGVDSNFFEMGGYSLPAFQVISRIRNSLDLEIPLVEIFAHPTIDELVGVIEAARGKESQAVVLEVISRDGPIPLSSAQKRLWFMDQINPGSSLYNIPMAVRIEGLLDIPRLQTAFDIVIRRHETLRSRFSEQDGQPLLEFRDIQSIPIHVVDLRYLPATQSTHLSGRLTRAEAFSSFDLSADPMFRVTLLRLGETTTLLLVTVHHIVFDGWSVGLLLNELVHIYDREDSPEKLLQLSIQYADYAGWEQRYLAGKPMDRLMAYWKPKLQGAPRLQWPMKKLGVADGSLAGRSHELMISKRLTDQLKDYCHHRGITLFTFMVAVFKTTLYRMTGQSDLVLGTASANRDRLELEKLIGLFVNLLVLRTDLSGNPPFNELLDRVQETVLVAAQHRDMPFERLIDGLGLKGTQTELPLVQAVFNMQNFPFKGHYFAGQEWYPLTTEDLMPKFEMAVFVTEPDAAIIPDPEGRMSIQFSYRSSLIKSGVEKMARQYAHLLEQFVEAPSLKLNEVVLHKEESVGLRKSKRMNLKGRGLKGARRRSETTSRQELVSKVPLEGATLPLVIQPNRDNVDLAEWAKANRETILADLLKSGALLFRGFSVKSVDYFGDFARTMCDKVHGSYGDLPPEGKVKDVYKSTPYPEDMTILFHNESSHMNTWPRHQFFSCVIAAKKGGETPVVDCRVLFQELDADLKAMFVEKDLLYVRNFHPGLDVAWQDFFKTDSRDVVETTCRQNGMSFEWLPNDGLRTTQTAPAVICHPVTGERSFFNQIELHHIAFIDPNTRKALLEAVSERELPRNVYFGDGCPIPDEAIETITKLYEKHAVPLKWQVGDVVMLDNMLTAHARYPYEGPRKIVVALGDMVRQEDIVGVN